MPVVAVNIELRILKKIRGLIDSGAYENPEQFMQVAAYNQLALESQATKDSAAKPKKSASRPNRRKTAPRVKSRARTSRTRKQPKASTTRSSARTTAQRTISDTDLAPALAQFQRPGGAKWLGPEPIVPVAREPGEYLWGQINRLLPLKLACRWLAVHAASSGHWSTYDRIADRLANDVAVVGSALEEIEKAMERKRDEVISTALPRKNNPASRTRYVSQFLVRATRSGELHPGAIVQYGLARTDETNDQELVLTTLGVGFARLENPVLDGDWQTAMRGINEAEAHYLLTEVLPFVPGELDAVRDVISGIASGANTPSSLADRLQPSLPDSWTEAALRTHVAGLIGRMVDMGLVERRWEGRRAFYELGPMVNVLADAGIAAAR